MTFSILHWKANVIIYFHGTTSVQSFLATALMFVIILYARIPEPASPLKAGFLLMYMVHLSRLIMIWTYRSVPGAMNTCEHQSAMAKSASVGGQIY